MALIKETENIKNNLAAVDDVCMRLAIVLMLISSISLILSPFQLAAEEPDSWTYNDQSFMANSENALAAWCKDGLSRPVYSNSALKGYKRCSSFMRASSVCDPSGNRFISSKGAPDLFRDCSEGKRIQITTIKGTHYASGDPLPLRLPYVSNKGKKMNDYMSSLDRLIGKKEEKNGQNQTLLDPAMLGGFIGASFNPEEAAKLFNEIK